MVERRDKRMNRQEMIERLSEGEKPIDVSIEKWKDIVRQIKQGFELDHIEYHVKTCALCELYYDSENECANCDYARYYGHTCDNVYEKKAWIWFDDSITKNDKGAARRAAQAMIAELEAIKRG